MSRGGSSGLTRADEQSEVARVVVAGDGGRRDTYDGSNAPSKGLRRGVSIQVGAEERPNNIMGCGTQHWRSA